MGKDIKHGSSCGRQINSTIFFAIFLLILTLALIADATVHERSRRRPLISVLARNALYMLHRRQVCPLHSTHSQNELGESPSSTRNAFKDTFGDAVDGSTEKTIGGPACRVAQDHA